MKELSIEEKAKAYDKVLEKVRSWHDNYEQISTLVDVKEELEEIFSELKESEDERIKKALITFFQRFPYENIDVAGTNVKEAIAWLEKHGEQKPAWGKEDERYLSYAIHAVEDMLGDNGKNIVAWLKSLRPQNKNVMDEDFEDTILKIKTYIAQCNGFNRKHREEVFRLIDSLRPQNRWKPSEEQMLAINTSINVIGKGTLTGKYLTELHEQLKAL